MDEYDIYKHTLQAEERITVCKHGVTRVDCRVVVVKAEVNLKLNQKYTAKLCFSESLKTACIQNLYKTKRILNVK